jgi:hypothetical protein
MVIFFTKQIFNKLKQNEKKMGEYYIFLNNTVKIASKPNILFFLHRFFNMSD